MVWYFYSYETAYQSFVLLFPKWVKQEFQKNVLDKSFPVCVVAELVNVYVVYLFLFPFHTLTVNSQWLSSWKHLCKRSFSHNDSDNCNYTIKSNKFTNDTKAKLTLKSYNLILLRSLKWDIILTDVVSNVVYNLVVAANTYKVSRPSYLILFFFTIVILLIT